MKFLLLANICFGGVNFSEGTEIDSKDIPDEVGQSLVERNLVERNLAQEIEGIIEPTIDEIEEFTKKGKK